MDKFDWAILNELQTNGRLTNAELAQRVGLSAAPCWRRVRALEESGVIQGYRAEINRQKVGLDVLAFVRLDAERNRGDITRQLEEAILKIPEVVSCHYISGTGTFELQVVSKDLNTFSTRFGLPTCQQVVVPVQKRLSRSSTRSTSKQKKYCCAMQSSMATTARC